MEITAMAFPAIAKLPKAKQQRVSTKMSVNCCISLNFWNFQLYLVFKGLAKMKGCSILKENRAFVQLK